MEKKIREKRIKVEKCEEQLKKTDVIGRKNREVLRKKSKRKRKDKRNR